jgi:hypothetical protein
MMRNANGQTPPTDATQRGLKATMTLLLPGQHSFNDGSVSDKLDNLADFVERPLGILEYEARAIQHDFALPVVVCALVAASARVVDEP